MKNNHFSDSSNNNSLVKTELQPAMQELALTSLQETYEEIKELIKDCRWRADIRTLPGEKMNRLHFFLTSQNKKISGYAWWQLAFYSSCDEETYMGVWELYGQHFTIEDLRFKPAVEGANKGNSVQWLLIEAVYAGRVKPFMTVWEKLGSQWPFDELRPRLPEAIYKLGFHAGHNPNPFLAFWRRFSAQLTVKDLRFQEQGGDHKGKTTLWVLALATTHGPAEPFMEVWRKFGSEFTIDDLRSGPLQGFEEGRNALWLIASAAERDLRVFKSVWLTLGRELTLEDFRATKALPEPFNACLSVLQLLVLHRHPVIENLLQQVPEIFDEADLSFKSLFLGNKNILALLQEHHDWENKIKPLLAARQPFFSELARLRADPTLEDFSRLKNLAKDALAANYFNAFYDVGCFFEERGLKMAAWDAFESLDDFSFHYDQINQEGLFTFYAQATETFHWPEKKYLLERALKFGFKCPESLLRAYLQKIAFSYTTEGNQPGLTQEDLNPICHDLLDVMIEKRSIDWCFKRFDEMKAQKTLERKLQILIMQNQLLESENKKLHKKMAAKEANLSLSDPILTWQHPLAMVRYSRGKLKAIYPSYSKTYRNKVSK